MNSTLLSTTCQGGFTEFDEGYLSRPGTLARSQCWTEHSNRHLLSWSWSSANAKPSRLSSSIRRCQRWVTTWIKNSVVISFARRRNDNLSFRTSTRQIINYLRIIFHAVWGWNSRTNQKESYVIVDHLILNSLRAARFTNNTVAEWIRWNLFATFTKYSKMWYSMASKGYLRTKRRSQ